METTLKLFKWIVIVIVAIVAYGIFSQAGMDINDIGSMLGMAVIPAKLSRKLDTARFHLKGCMVTGIFAGSFVTFGAMVLVALSLLFGVVKDVSAKGEYVNPYTVVCNDPLMTNVTLVLADCGEGKQERRQSQKDMQVEEAAQIDSPAITTITDTQEVESPVIVPAAPVETSTPEESNEGKQKCNKGEGNGGEGCDPGNHPERGNDDENDTTPREDRHGAIPFFGMLVTPSMLTGAVKLLQNRPDGTTANKQARKIAARIVTSHANNLRAWIGKSQNRNSAAYKLINQHIADLLAMAKRENQP